MWPFVQRIALSLRVRIEFGFVFLEEFSSSICGCIFFLAVVSGACVWDYWCVRGYQERVVGEGRAWLT